MGRIHLIRPITKHEARSTIMKKIALLSGGDGWHVRDLRRAAELQGHQTAVVDFRKIQAGIGTWPGEWLGFDALMVRTMPPGSLEQVVFRMDVLHRVKAQGMSVLNPPSALETCI